MYDNTVIAELKKVVGWKNHYNLTDIPALTAYLNVSESGRYFNNNSFSPLVRLDYIKAMLPSDRPLEEFLDEVVDDACNEILNSVAEKKKLTASGKDIVTSNLIFKEVVRGNPITNEGRFVGVRFRLGDSVGIRATINRIGLFLTAAQPSLTLYLFNSLQDQAVDTFTYTSAGANSFQWLIESVIMDFDDASGTSGGVWYLGYYQDDLVGSAIQYNTLNWINGYCGSCGNGNANTYYKQITKYVGMMPFYVASGSLPAVGTMFDQNDIVECTTNNFGFNFNITISCNLTQFWIDNKLTFADAIGKSVTLKVLEMIASSSQSSGVEQNLQPMALRAIEGDSATKATAYIKKVERAIECIVLDEGNVKNNPCLPCARKGANIKVL